MLYLHSDHNLLNVIVHTSFREYLGDRGEAVDEKDDCWAGRLFIISTTFIDEDRSIRKEMFGVTAISNKAGHPHTFLTVICSP